VIALMHCLATIYQPIAMQDAAVLLKSQTGKPHQTDHQPTLVQSHPVPNMPKITSDVNITGSSGSLGTQ